jgi:tetratricopeptide (TPR) repeat protein
MGLVYMALTAVSLRFWRDERVRLLLLVILGFLIPVTLIDARESWNEFTWASSTVFAAILLSAFVIDHTLSSRWGRAMTSAVLAYAVVALLWFLAGPKWGYFCPELERTYVGRVLALELRSGYDPSQFPDALAAAEIRDVTDQVLARHSGSAVAWYYHGVYAETATERRDAFARVLELDPNNPLVMIPLADALTQAGDWAGAGKLLRGLLADHADSIQVQAALAEVEFQLGNYGSAAAHVRRVVALNPVEPHPYGFLFDIYDAMGEETQAEASLQAYAARHADGPAIAYQQLAEQFLRQADRSGRATARYRRAVSPRPDGAGTLSADVHLLPSSDITKLRNSDLAIGLATRACQLTEWKDPRCLRTLAAAYRTLGGALAGRGEFGRAIESYRRALEAAPGDVSALFDLAWLLAMCPDERLRNLREAIRLAEQGCDLTEHSDPVGLMILAAAYAQAGQFDVAIKTIEGALQLAEAAGNAELVAQLRDRLKRYQEGNAGLGTHRE